VAQAVEPRWLAAHTEFLSSDLLEGRAPGTRGGELAAAYIAAQFRRLGLEPAGDSGSYFHRVPIISLDPQPTLRVTGAVGTGARELRYKEDYVLWSMQDRPQVEASAPLVFVGYGIVAPEHGWNDYEGVDVTGKIVVAFVNDPGLMDSTIFRGKILTYYGRWTYKLEEAERQGAAGILLVHTTESATYGWPTVTGSWTGPQVRVERKPGPLQVAGWLSEATATQILRPLGADVPTLLRRAAARELRSQPIGGFTAAATVRSTIERSTTNNVLGRLPGRGARAGEIVLVGGHYDHLGVGEPVAGDSIFNGALDNASGTAAVLAAAEAFVRSGVRTERSLVFAGFAAEESGLLGSTALAQRPAVPLARTAAVLNMDVMNLYGRTRDIAALGVDQSSLGDLFTAAARAEGLRVTANEDALIKGSFFRSDHFPLARVGVPALSLESGLSYVGHPAGWGEARQEEYTEKYYHQPGDELLDWYTFDGAVQQLRVMLRTAVAAANAPTQPTWRKGSEFQAAGAARVRGR
jgi:Zn-dependent M28 family amino/carboxypeptidase